MKETKTQEGTTLETFYSNGQTKIKISYSTPNGTGWVHCTKYNQDGSVEYKNKRIVN